MLFSKKNKIKDQLALSFIAADQYIEDNLEIPSPARLEIPKWYRDTTSYFNGNSIEFFKNEPNTTATIKSCMPVLDVLSLGWIQKTWCDIIFEKNEEGITFRYSVEPAPIVVRDVESLGKLPVPDEYENIAFSWLRPWSIKTPPGYSILYTHPFYRYDLPFTCVSGLIDTDNYHSNGKVSFFLKKDFSGIIPKGTPMYQIIPYKKDSWVGKKTERNEENIKKLSKEVFDVKSIFSGGYKKYYWNKQSYTNE
jgi:hypothetical protein